MATKRSREEDGGVAPDAKKVHVDTARLLDDADTVDRVVESASVPGKQDAAEEGLVNGLMESLQEESHQAASVYGKQTSTLETATDSGRNNSIVDPVVCGESVLITALSADFLTVMNSSASVSGPQENDKMPENESASNALIASSVEAGSMPSGSPLGYLLGASDDELGLPPPSSTGYEFPTSFLPMQPAVGFMVDDWRFDEEFQAMRFQGFGFCEEADAWREPDVAADDDGSGSLFDHSGVADDGSFFLFSGNASS